MLLSLIIPTYNERENVPSLVERATETLKKQTDSFEIIVVDDDSPDGTWRIAEELAQSNSHVRVIRRQGERGLASAVVVGWNVARGEIIGVMDGDLQHPPEALPALLDPIIKRQADIAVGSRHIEGGGTRDWGFHRRFLSRAVSCFAKVMLQRILPPLRDPMSGFFLARRAVIRGVPLKPRGYKILLEVLAKGTYDKIIEVPFMFMGRKKGTSKAGPKQCLDSLVHFGQLLRAAPGSRPRAAPRHRSKLGEALAMMPALRATNILSLLAVFILGVANLPEPFWSDQAQYTFTAENMRDGFLLYRHAWDVKQPGIFYFYLAGGSLFGFNEVGIHLFELIWMLVFSIVLLLTLRGRFKDETLASLLPVFTVGVYFGTTGGLHQTQPESLMGFPTFLSLWFASRALQPASQRLLWLFLSGVMGGVVLVLKLMFMPIPLAFWLSALLWEWRAKAKPSLAVVLQSAMAIGVGVTVPLLVTVAHLFHHGVLDIAIWTFFTYPTSALSAWPLTINIRTLTDSVLWFLRNFAPVLALSLIGAYSRFARRGDYLTLNLILWVALGACVILLQRLSWFQSHFMLLVVPLGILAAWGVDTLLASRQLKGPIKVQQMRLVALTSVVLLFLPIWTPAAVRGALLARNKFASLLTKEELRRYQSILSQDYRDALRETAFLKSPESAPGDIYVIGDAIYYYLSGRDPAIPILVRRFVPPFLWAELVTALHHAPRPAYIFIANDFLSKLRKHTPEAVPYIDEVARFTYTNYDVLRASDAGTWYVLRRDAFAFPHRNRYGLALRRNGGHD